jgi:3-hydroxyisobutyrate dehydrogenase
VIHAGGLGTGQAAKICNNMLLGIQMIGTCEAFAMAQHLGLDPQKFYDIASVSSGQCWSMTSYCPVPGVGPNSPSDNAYQGGFATALMLKDLRLAMEAAESSGAKVPMGQRAKELYESFASAGNGGHQDALACKEGNHCCRNGWLQGEIDCALRGHRTSWRNC